MNRAALERSFRRALRGLDLGARVEAALPPSSIPVRVIAVGKAAPAMAAGALARYGGALERCLVVAPDGTRVDRLGKRVTVMRASHPLPDARSERAGAACLEIARSDEPRTVVVLVSGGASALACAPSAGVTLAKKRAVTAAMLASGASVQEMNVVRKHLSRLKGGGLLRAAGENRVVTIVASDVIGGTPADVGSGPSVPDASSIADARRLLRRYAPSHASVPLARTLAPSSSRSRVKVVLSPEDLPRAVGRLLEAAGMHVRVLPPSQRGAEELAAEYVTLALRAARSDRRPRAFLRAAEPSVTVEAGKGKEARGGRSTHVAALVGRALAAIPGRQIRFAALASDGVDGSSETGGAIVDARFAALVGARLGPNALDRAIATFDTGPLHRLVGSAVASAPTGHNLADLHVLLVE